MNKFGKPIVHGLGGAIIGWIVSAIITIVLGVIAAMLEVIEVRYLIALLVILTLVAPFVPGYLIGSMMADANKEAKSNKRTLGLIGGGLALIVVSLPLVLIIRDNFPIEFMHTLDQPDWVGTVMTWYAWLSVVVNPLLTFALVAEITLRGSRSDRPGTPSI